MLVYYYIQFLLQRIHLGELENLGSEPIVYMDSRILKKQVTREPNLGYRLPRDRIS